MKRVRLEERSVLYARLQPSVVIGVHSAILPLLRAVNAYQEQALTEWLRRKVRGESEQVWELVWEWVRGEE